MKKYNRGMQIGRWWSVLALALGLVLTAATPAASQVEPAASDPQAMPGSSSLLTQLAMRLEQEAASQSEEPQEQLPAEWVAIAGTAQPSSASVGTSSHAALSRSSVAPLQEETQANPPMVRQPASRNPIPAEFNDRDASSKESKPASVKRPAAKGSEPKEQPKREDPASPKIERTSEPVPVSPAGGTEVREDTQGSVNSATIQNILGGMDPSAFNLSGAELEVEVVGDTIIMQGSEDDVAMLEMLLTMVDQSFERKELRLVQVEQRDANEVAPKAQETLRAVFSYPNMRTEDELSVTALSSNIILVAALPRQVEFIVDVIHSIDEIPPRLPEFESINFPIKHMRATEVATQLEEVLTKIQERQGARGAEAEIQIIPNDASNSLMVIAPESEREKIQGLINGIDVEPVEGWGTIKLTLFPLLHTPAQELADTINELLEAPDRRDEAEAVISKLIINRAELDGKITELPPIDLEKTTKIIPDEGTNSLIVATIDENIMPMGELIRLLDGVPAAEDIGVRFFPLEFANADTLKTLLDDMFSEGQDLPEEPDGTDVGAVPSDSPGEALVYNVSIVADQRSNTLVVSGRPEQMQLIEMVVTELDTPAVALKFPLTLIRLEYADATRIGKLITDLIDKRIESLEATDADGSAIERERVFLSVDIRGNSLVVSASSENLAEINGIVDQLDTKPAQLFDNIRIIALNRHSPADMKEKIDELWSRKSDLLSEFELPDDTPVIVADERSNALMIASTQEDYDEMKEMIDALESLEMIDGTRLFELKYADAKALAWKLDELFDGLEGLSETLKAPKILPDERTNSLIVAATQDGMERVADLVERLDVKAGTKTAVFRVYDVEHSMASRLAPKMQQLFEERQEGQDAEQTPIVIMAEEMSNKLVCSASVSDHEMVIELLELLDTPSSLARQFAIFPLKEASASRVSEQLSELFQAQADTDGPDRADAVAMEADDRTNSIIVWASSTELENIGVVISKLDRSGPAKTRKVKIIQLKQALAEDFAQVLQESLIGDNAGSEDEEAVFVTWDESRDDGSVIRRKMLRQDIKVTADARTNSLMVWAPEESMGMLEALIQDFDRIRPITSQVRMFPLINSDAQAMKDQLTELFDSENSNSNVLSKVALEGDFGDLDWSSVGNDLRFVAEERTNTLIAAGNQMDLHFVEEIVRWLDSQNVEERITEVYHARYRDAGDIATAVKSFSDQEQDVYGNVDDETSQMRLADRRISVESIDESEDGGGSSLIWAASRQNYARTLEMIRQLDRPEPQVMIQVLVAEVILSDDVELGIELAGQDLEFSENAVLGPNGIIQGSDFDWVTGTDVGAIGQLQGFNFTITGEDFGFLMHALQRDSRVEVLQRPVLMVRNGGEGEISISDEIPYVSESRLSDTGQTQSTVGREKVGIILKTKPHISPDGYVKMEIEQEISSFSGENIQLTEGVSQPVISERTVKTFVTVRDGETVVIGGLITTRESEGETKVPLLGDMPLVGPLFRTTSVSRSRTELMVVLTVEILDTDSDMERMSAKQMEQFELTPNIRQSPLMESLRINPGESLLGPQERGVQPTQPVRRPSGQPVPIIQPDNNHYGPKPKIYGPMISKPKSVTTTNSPNYGPKTAAIEVAEKK